MFVRAAAERRSRDPAPRCTSATTTWGFGFSDETLQRWLSNSTSWRDVWIHRSSNKVSSQHAAVEILTVSFQHSGLQDKLFCLCFLGLITSQHICSLINEHNWCFTFQKLFIRVFPRAPPQSDTWTKTSTRLHQGRRTTASRRSRSFSTFTCRTFNHVSTCFP